MNLKYTNAWVAEPCYQVVLGTGNNNNNINSHAVNEIISCQVRIEGLDRHLHEPHFTHTETEAQRGQATCPKSWSKEEAELGSQPSWDSNLRLLVLPVEQQVPLNLSTAYA
jgi:hypothetical protein